MLKIESYLKAMKHDMESDSENKRRCLDKEMEEEEEEEIIVVLAVERFVSRSRIMRTDE